MIMRSVMDTRAAGRALAARLTPGDLVLLEGPLGSGKTTFVQGVAEGLGVPRLPTSPSFVIVNEYPIRVSSEQGFILRHIDLYRLPDPAVDMDRIGLPELLGDPQAITVVEWADRIPAATLAKVGRLPAGAVRKLGGPAAGRIIRVWFEHGESEAIRVIHAPDI